MTTTLFLGVAISLLVTEFTGYSPGGVVTAGYLAAFLFQPAWLAGTAAAAVLTYGMVLLVERRLLLYGRRQFAVYVLAGLVVSQGMASLRPGHWLDSDAILLVVGYLVPGLLARDFSRQGVGATLMVASLTVLLVRMAVLAGENWLW